jgi:hypothetical protein
LLEDQHLALRGVFRLVDDDQLGHMRLQSAVPRFSACEGPLEHLGPELGADTDSVLRDVLRLSCTDLEGLRQLRHLNGGPYPAYRSSEQPRGAAAWRLRGASGARSRPACRAPSAIKSRPAGFATGLSAVHDALARKASRFWRVMIRRRPTLR